MVKKKLGKVRDGQFYNDSKMANVLFTKELAKRLEGTGVQTYALCPGLVKTDIGRHMPFFQMVIIYGLYEVMGKSASEGCQTTLFCALSKHKNVVDRSGEMYQNCSYWLPEKRVPVPDEDAFKLWNISEKLVEYKKQ